ncbi:AAA family ATPase [Lapidilactobacillus gannanensis]|jgi:adenylate kinase family enzyme|uniref:AAA family ATPase n=1 Tax=Lapidilactobacillus gannanensis TaxID=2486002 RepID=A0ABW4BNN8_9LACO|nr:AAA family ATPase [Lapidilactobacillus gannanensis]MCH4057538.1 AAA family ATPase [Lactobacillaceae bacterium]
MKIALIGSPGSGKSTFAKKLTTATAWPVLSLDYYWHQMDYSETASEKLLQIQMDFMAQNKDWVIDGNYSHTMAPRMVQADITIWFQISPLVAVKRVVGRSLQDRHNGHNRPEMAPNFEEHFDREYWEFIKFIWHYPKSHNQYVRELHQKVAPNKPLLLLHQADKAQVLQQLVTNPGTLLTKLSEL